MTNEISGSVKERPITTIRRSKFYRYSGNYWTKSDGIEKLELQMSYLKKIEEGPDAWNEWSNELESFITANNLNRNSFKIHLSGIDIKVDDFRDFSFPVPIDFSHSTFTSKSLNSFNFAIFKCNVNFSNSKFIADADFNDATFHKTVAFDGATFQKVIDLTSSRFEGVASFKNCTFQKTALFIGCEFKKNTSFSGTLFSSSSLFIKSHFLDSADFFNCTFNGDSNFKDIKFFSSANFLNASFEKVCAFEGARFETSVPEFNYCEFKQPPFLSRMEIPEIYPAGDKSNTERYRRLKSLAITSHDHEQELKFFSYEMKSKMENAAHRMSTRTYTPIRLYELTSSFGRSIGKPIVCLLGLWVISLVLHYVTLSPTTNCKSDSAYSKEVAVMSYVSSHSFPLFLSDKRAKKATDDCLFGKEQPPSLIIQFVGFFQSLLSAVFAFLIGLGIRNRFKIRD